MGDLAYWMDENFLLSLFGATGEVLSAKIIRNKVTGYSEGYGFVEFTNNFAAQKVLQTYNGAPISGTDHFFKLNWASHSGGGGGGSSGNQEAGDGSEYSVFVGDLSPDVTDYTLQEFFRQFYPSVKSARVVTDPVTGRPKGYGFVRFLNEAERDKAMLEMSGQVIGSRAVRVSLATPKKSSGGGGGASVGGGFPPGQFQPVGMGMGMAYPMMQQQQGPDMRGMQQQESSNTTLYVGGISPTTTDEDIRAVFSDFGEIRNIKIASGKACAFVHYRERSCAEKALVATNGFMIKGNAVRVSWGRHSEPRNMMPGSNVNPYAAQMAGYYGYYYTPNQYYNYGMQMQNPAAMVPGMQPGMMPSPPQVAAAQMVQNSDATTINKNDSNNVGLGGKSPSVEEMNKSYSSMTAPYTVESNAFITSVPPTAASTLNSQ